MRRKPVVVLIAGVLAVVVASGAWVLQGRPDPLPSSVVNTAAGDDELADFSGRRIFFGHQSVGANIIDGLKAAYSGREGSGLDVVETRTDPGRSGGYLAHAAMGVNGDPLGKLADFEKVLAGSMGGAVDLAVLKLCYIDVTADTDVDALFRAYSQTMTRLEAAHPGVTFIYTTVPLTTDRTWKQTVKSWIGRDEQTGPDDNAARQRYNRLVRERYGDSDRLFDIAAVQATMDSSPTSRTRDGSTYYVLHDRLAADPGHLNALGSRVAAARLVHLVAAQH
ncbi:hypothetical protein [Acidipropionibacterium acidipropionici]|uniref:hypothetical protein n=1 Tax=Acidipropionibacterium acidipropionici TaxID=1748 RepID=UPI00041BD819|nr:hypothetical protein [Acidipropionibacterium acidipropionici]ALN15884.1 hypothetical protein ASQ49_12155 [Acidipropionibacterium acidipropionici]APZ08369.1 hypothetical protein BWX38_02745 [Acidipropionibacterium acidipropionici]QCV94908.1 hypothetical protein FEZ30_06190 [Acidipropionibacterium acidipropionici]